MCYAVYIATNKELEEKYTNPKNDEIRLSKIGKQQKEMLGSKFSKENIYYMGSDSKSCSCGFAYHSQESDSLEEIEENQKDPKKLIQFLKEITLFESVEFYCCWEGDQGKEIQSRRKINIENITMENYFGLVEQDFITFIRTFKPNTRRNLVTILEKNEEGKILKAIKSLRKQEKTSLIDARVYVEFLAIDVAKVKN